VKYLRIDDFLAFLNNIDGGYIDGFVGLDDSGWQHTLIVWEGTGGVVKIAAASKNDGVY